MLAVLVLRFAMSVNCQLPTAPQLVNHRSSISIYVYRTGGPILGRTRPAQAVGFEVFGVLMSQFCSPAEVRYAYKRVEAQIDRVQAGLPEGKLCACPASPATSASGS